MTDYTEVRMRISWVVLTTLVMAAAASNNNNNKNEEKTLSAAVLTITRALQDEARVPALLHIADSEEGSQEYQSRGTTLVVKRRSKTPLLFSAAAAAPLPAPVEIRSDTLLVKDAEDGSKGGRSGRQISRLGSDGVVEITGIRVPDDEADKRQTWRNARVIKNMLVGGSVGTQRQQRQVDVTVLDQGPTAVRAPILQYAHPELGVQPALQQSTSRELEHSRQVAPVFHSQPSAPVYFAQDSPQDIHNDHSPYQFEPAESYKESRPYEERKAYELRRPVKKPVAHKDFSYADYEKYKIKQKFYAPADQEMGSYASFYAPEDTRPFWQRIGDLIRDNVQAGYTQMETFARPVVNPILTASKAISANFGPVFGANNNNNNRHHAQEKTGVAAPVMLGAAPLVVPALMAGGAVLGLGAAAVSKYLETTQVVHGRSNRRRRALLTGGSPLISLQEQMGADEDRVMLTNAVHGAAMPKDTFLAQLSKYGHSRWREETPCAKRIFCDVMTQQPQDMSILMEKRISIFLSLLNESVARALSSHMGEVLEAVRNHDCSSFQCPSERQIGVSVGAGAFQNANGRRLGPR